MKLQAGETVLIRMQYHQSPGSKVRPALVLLDASDDDFVAAPITSRARSSECDFTIQEWRAAGLNVPSTARVHKLTVLAKVDIARRLGACSSADRELLSNLLCRIFCPSEA